MAIAVLGGLATATFLNLVILPETLIRMQGWLGLDRFDLAPMTSGEGTKRATALARQDA